MKRGYASIKSGQVHYAEAGEGAPLLLLHSAPRSSRAYRLLLPQLAPHFRAIAPDLPGFGMSDALRGKVTMEALGDAMVEFLGALGIGKAHVFGYHTGNKVAAAMAADHPQRLEGLVLCGQIHSIIPDTTARNDAIRHIVDKYFAEYPASPNGDEHLRRWLADWSDVSGFALPRSVFSKKPLRREDIEDLKVRVLDHVQAISALKATYAANFHFDFGAALRRIAARTLVLELVMPDEEHYGRQLEAVCALIKDSRGATIMNAGKVVLESHTEELARHLIGFLSEAA
jgi:pimeloyl-ACP methyl ester carboxylesterase